MRTSSNGETRCATWATRGTPIRDPTDAWVGNGLMANSGLGQSQRNGEAEAPLLTSSADTTVVAELVPLNEESYSANDVLEHLLGRTRPTQEEGRENPSRSVGGGYSRSAVGQTRTLR